MKFSGPLGIGGTMSQTAKVSDNLSSASESISNILDVFLVVTPAEVPESRIANRLDLQTSVTRRIERKRLIRAVTNQVFTTGAGHELTPSCLLMALSGHRPTEKLGY